MGIIIQMIRGSEENIWPTGNLFAKLINYWYLNTLNSFMYKPAKILDKIQPSVTSEVNAAALALIEKGKNIIKLNIGEPDFDTPAHVKQAAIDAIHANETRYTQVDGTPALKAAIIKKFYRDNDLTYNPKQIIVSSGAKHSLFNLFTAIINPGDEVIIPAPYWVSYPEMIKLCGGKPILADTMQGSQLKLTKALLTQLLTKNTKLLIINSPSNPTGAAYSKAELRALGEVLLEYPQLLIATDDIYEHIYWGKEPFCNIVMACPELYSRTIVINGPSKVYAMTGWRIGYAAGDESIIAAMRKYQSQTTSNPCSISQAATLAALSGDQTAVISNCQAYKQRHDYLTGALNELPGFQCLPADGTFYAFANVKEAINMLPGINDDIDCANFLLKQAEVSTIPGTAFGAPGYIRFSYAIGMETLKQAISQMKAALLSHIKPSNKE